MTDLTKISIDHLSDAHFVVLEQQTSDAFRCRNFQLARQNLLILLQIQPDHYIKWANLALAELRLGLYHDAYAHYLHAIQGMTTDINPVIYDGMVEVCYFLGKTTEQKKFAQLSLHAKQQEVEQQAKFSLNLPRLPFNRTTPQKNIISFSLFGALPRYCETAILNVKKAREIYPAWTCRFYVDYSVPFHVVLRLQYLGADVIYVTEEQRKISGLFWRFLVMEDPNVDFYLIRDADSLVSYREKAAVEAWLDSEQYFHVMRDGYSHTDLIFAGMFGGSGQVFSNLLTQFQTFTASGQYLNQRVMDQHFLRYMIWPTLSQSVMIHDSQGYTPDGLDFPMPIQQPEDECIADFHVGYNQASYDLTVQFSYQATRIAWLLIDEQQREICRYEQQIAQGQQAFIIGLPWSYMQEIRAGRWKILHHAI